MRLLKIRSDTNAVRMTDPATVPSIIPASAPLLMPDDEGGWNSVTEQLHMSAVS